MATVQVFESKSCPKCKAITMHTGTKQEVNHVLHLIATLFLCGFWLPVWLFLAFATALEKTVWQCQKCGIWHKS